MAFLLSTEIVPVCGATVLANYGFRDMTYDVGAVIRASSSMKDAINRFGDEMGLPNRMCIFQNRVFPK